MGQKKRKEIKAWSHQVIAVRVTQVLMSALESFRTCCPQIFSPSPHKLQGSNLILCIGFFVVPITIASGHLASINDFIATTTS